MVQRLVKTEVSIVELEADREMRDYRDCSIPENRSISDDIVNSSFISLLP